MKNFYAHATPWGTIRTGSLFTRLSPDEQAAVLAHERGHIAHGHALTRLRWVLTFKAFRHPERYFAMCAKQELEADRWALLEGHGQALARLIARFKDGGRGYPTKRERLARLV